MKEHEELFRRLDVEGKEYIKVYVKSVCKGKVIDLNGFSDVFEEYVGQRPIKKDGYRSVSLKSFQDFLVLRHALKKVKFV